MFTKHGVYPAIHPLGQQPMIASRPLVAALLAALPITASAELSVNSGGRGDALYLPLFDVAEGRDSLITVRNSGSAPVLARVVFSESLNGQSTLSFNVFLPPLSTWTAAVVDDGDGATLASASPLCSVPSVTRLTPPLRNFDYAQNHPDGGSAARSRTRRGAVEIFALATLQGSLAEATIAGNCQGLEAAYQSGATRGASLAAPAPTLSANVQVVEVAEGTVYALPAVAIRGLLAGAVDAQPGADLPRLVTPQLAPGATHHVANTPAGRFRFPASRGADAVSSLFMASAVSGEVVSDVELEGSTQWLLAFPTKNAYVADVPGSLAGSGPVQPPFRERFATDGSCEPAQAAEVDVRGWQRHIDVPLQPFDYQLCAQVNLQGFDTSDGGGSDLVRFDDTPQRQIEAEREDGTPVRLKGLPVVGWRLSRFSNAAAQPGVLASYTVALPLQSEPAVVEAR
jgi:hypothetical protein